MVEVRVMEEKLLRRRGLKLVMELCRRDRRCARELLGRQEENVRQMLEVDWNLVNVRRRVGEYVGLKNLGATCYINSLI